MTTRAEYWAANSPDYPFQAIQTALADKLFTEVEHLNTRRTGPCLRVPFLDAETPYVLWGFQSETALITFISDFGGQVLSEEVSP